MSYDILSPDGFPIHPVEIYPTPEAAWEAFEEWKKRFQAQGYYSSNRGRIALDRLKDYCELVECDDESGYETDEVEELIF